jgi:uncharacterized protein YgfB (UPF0149 family)
MDLRLLVPAVGVEAAGAVLGVACTGVLSAAVESWLEPLHATTNSRLSPPIMTAARFVALASNFSPALRKPRSSYFA